VTSAKKHGGQVLGIAQGKSNVSFWGTALALDSRYDGTNIEERGVNVKKKMMG